jgi:AhpD family alkylhydroperoxidase
MKPVHEVPSHFERKNRLAKIPYADSKRPEAVALTARIIEERGSLLHIYAMLLHSLPVAEGWLAFLTAIRNRCELPGSLRELVIIEVALLNGAPYEAEQHAPIALREGLTSAQFHALPNWQSSALFMPPQRAALAYCDAMTRLIHVPTDVFEEVRGHFNERTMVELTATIAAYNMVSRFLEAFGIASTDPT